MHLLAVDQGELRAGVDADAGAISRRSVELGRVPGAAPRAGHHAFVGPHGGGYWFRLLLSERGSGYACDGAERRDQQGKCTRNSGADHDDLDPETMKAHDSVCSRKAGWTLGTIEC